MKNHSEYLPDVLSEAGILQILRGTLALHPVVDRIQEYLAKNKSVTHFEVISKELLAPILDLSKSLHSLCLSLHSKVTKTLSKTAGRRNRKTSESEKRSSESLNNLWSCVRSFEEIDINKDSLHNLLVCTHYIRRQLSVVASYLSEK